MLNKDHPVARLLRKDRRYRFDAYAFVVEAMNYAHEKLGMGADQPAECEEEEPDPAAARSTPPQRGERHLTGQQLCEAMRRYALDQFGYLARPVLNAWGVQSTSDFGEIVFNLIEIGQFKKTRRDRREDFNNVFDFESGLTGSFKIALPECGETT